MGRIWIKCPATGRYASTGIVTDNANLAKFPDQLKNIRCPACGMRHQWLSDDAWLTEANDSAELFRKAGSRSDPMALEDIPPHLKAGFRRLVAKAKSDLKEVGIDTAQLLPAQMLKMASDERHRIKRYAAAKAPTKTGIKP